MLKQQFLKAIQRGFLGILFLILSLSVVHAEDESPEISSVEMAFPSLVIEDDVKQKLDAMKLRLNENIEQWGNGLTRDDFEWTWSGRMLKQPKRVEICNIFQGVINETYHLLRQNQSTLSAVDQKNIESRQAFIKQLGIEDNKIPTKMGFNCIIK